MNETSTKINECSGGTRFQIRKIESNKASEAGLVNGKRGHTGFIHITKEDRECGGKKSSQEDDKRGFDASCSSDTSGHTPGYNGSSTVDGRLFTRAFSNIRSAPWKTRISSILSLPFLLLVWIYRTVISPLTPSTCIYTPTCSQYAIEAISKHGLKGVWLSVKRIIRCRPGMPGGYDPIP